jgi:regulator of sirC expression with transglutaminase-like and TPR domain
VKATKEIQAMLALLEDPDPEIHQRVMHGFVDRGPDVIPILKSAGRHHTFGVLAERLEWISDEIRFNHLFAQLEDWKTYRTHDLGFAFRCVEAFQYPDDSLVRMDQWISRVRKEIWLGMSEELSAIERIRVLNHVLFAMYHLRGVASEEDAKLSHFFLSRALDSGKASPVLLVLLYLFLAQSMELPVQPVPLPKHYVLAYMESQEAKDIRGQSLAGKEKFFINPFSRGAVFSRREIEHFLIQSGHEGPLPQPEPCSFPVFIAGWLSAIRDWHVQAGHARRADHYSRLIRLLA